MLKEAHNKLQIENNRLLALPFDPELLSILRSIKESLEKKTRKQKTVIQRNIIIENRKLFFILRDKKREIMGKFKVKLDFYFDNKFNKNPRDKAAAPKPKVIIASETKRDVMICVEYLEKIIENSKFIYYDANKYASLIKNKLDDIKNRHKLDDMIIDLYSPQNGRDKLSLFASSAANDGKVIVQSFFKNFEFSNVKRSFNAIQFNLVKEKVSEIEDQSNVKIINLNKIDTFELIGDEHDIEVADGIIHNILSDSKITTKIIYPILNRFLTINYLKNIKKQLKNGDLNLFFNTTDVEYELVEQYDAIRYQCKSTNLQETISKLVTKLEEIGQQLTRKVFAILPNIFRHFQDTPTYIASIEERHQVKVFFPEKELRPIMVLSNKLANINLYVCVGNIINASSDVLVNSVNINMDANSGVAKAISDAAGNEYNSECRLIPKPLNPSEYYETSAGRLNSDRIINIVVPSYKSNSRIDELVNLYINCIYKCIKKGYTSISFPLLGAGVNNWPIRETMNALAKSIDLINFKTCLQDVYLVEYDNENIESKVKCLNEATFLNLEIISSSIKIEKKASNKTWYWLDDDKQWKQFRSDINAKINSNVDAKVNIFTLSINSKHFLIDTERKTQTNVISKTERPISDSVPQIRVGQWFWIDKNHEVAYNVKNNAEIEDAYLKELQSVRICLKRHSDDKDCYYVINFSKLTQTNEKTGYTRRVIRNVSVQDAFVLVEDEIEDEGESIDNFNINIRVGGELNKVNAAINEMSKTINNFKVTDMIKDCNISSVSLNIWKENKFKIVNGETGGNLELYKQFVKIYQKENNIIFESQIKNDLIEIKEQVLTVFLKLKSIQSKIIYPPEWTDTLNNVQLRSVAKTTKEWLDIEANFKKTISKKTVLEIHRIQNKSIWKTYYDEKIYIEGKRDKLNEIFLWHGTRNTKPQCIYEGNCKIQIKISFSNFLKN